MSVSWRSLWDLLEIQFRQVQTPDSWRYQKKGLQGQHVVLSKRVQQTTCHRFGQANVDQQVQCSELKFVITY